MKNTFGWMQLGTSDLKKAKDFYSKLFDWSLTEKRTKDGPYTEIDAGEGPCGGMGQAQNKEESHWIAFVNVNDIHTYTDKAKSLGAQIIFPITDLGGNEGFFSIFKDPTGAVLGLYAPK